MQFSQSSVGCIGVQCVGHVAWCVMMMMMTTTTMCFAVCNVFFHDSGVAKFLLLVCAIRYLLFWCSFVIKVRICGRCVLSDCNKREFVVESFEELNL